MKLVIVESPAKCETIKRYLGQDYMVEASLGHICDLATSGKGGLGVDVENGFKPTYIISNDKKSVVNDLIHKAHQSDEVILATDPDREGEAIAWHLANVLKLDVKKAKRLEFHEITRDSITEAMKHPRTIDLNLVSSQETRRILDRIIGFKLSNLIYKKIKSRSAGRVQSATLKMVAEHEAEIVKFVQEEYWVVHVKIKLGRKEYELDYIPENPKQGMIKSEEIVKNIIDSLGEQFVISSIERKKVTKESKEPFTTSTLQQEAFSRLKFKTSKTQRIAQKLYEGINVGDEHMGLITYIRTDSTRLSPTFIERANRYILERFGKEYMGHQKEIKHQELAQDAHEAIRPTKNHRTPESVRQYLKEDEYNLYKLIYNRALGSLMKPKVEEVMTINLDNNGVKFKLELTRTLFPGYEILEQKKEHDDVFPDLNEGSVLPLVSKEYEKKMTQPPAHYSEAKIVKMMEDAGIGRPSTYAATIDILNKRGYTTNKDGLLIITDQGIKTNRVLEKYFPDIVNAKYTASMEKRLDDISEGNETRESVLSSFYYPFVENIEDAAVRMYKDPQEEADGVCPKCGSKLVYKDGPHGRFIGCSNYPKCKYVQKEEKEKPEETGDKCPQCGRPLVYRKDAKGKKFIACSGYPACEYVKPLEETVSDKVIKPCPKCGGNLVRKKGIYGYFLGCTNYPTCSYMEKIIRKKKKQNK